MLAGKSLMLKAIWSISRPIDKQNYKVLILEKDLVFYKIYEDKKEVTVYAVADQRQEYLSIVRGL